LFFGQISAKNCEIWQKKSAKLAQKSWLDKENFRRNLAKKISKIAQKSWLDDLCVSEKIPKKIIILMAGKADLEKWLKFVLFRKRTFCRY